MIIPVIERAQFCSKCDKIATGHCTEVIKSESEPDTIRIVWVPACGEHDWNISNVAI